MAAIPNHKWYQSSWLELEEVEPWIEEQIELLHSYAKELGEEKVSALMEQHQDGKR